MDKANIGALELQVVNDCLSAQYKSQMLSQLFKAIEAAK
jgi:hypothetical protein